MTYQFKAGEVYTVYADGSSLDNGKPYARGGWAFIILDKDEQYELWQNYGAEPGATNNQMELRAAIEAIEALPKGCFIHMKLDSTYVLKGCSEWLKGWIAKGFKGVKNEGLWHRMVEALEGKKFQWTWVKGHADSRYNQKVDKLAVAASSRLPK